MKNKILNLMLLAGVALVLTGCSIDQSKPKSPISKAEILNWDKILEETNGNKSLAEDYENRSYVFMGRVQEIEIDSCDVSGFIVELDKEELKKLSVGDTIVVIGTLKDATTKPKLEKATRLDKQTVVENYLIGLVKKRTSGDGMSVIMEYKYSDYTFDENTHLVNSYIEINTTYTDEKAKNYKLKYDEKNNIIEKGDQFETYSYLYNEDNTVQKETHKMGNFTYIYDYSYEKDDNGHIIKKTKKDENGKNTVYTYEYGNNDKVSREIVTDDTQKWDYTFEYNNDGQLVKKNWKAEDPLLDNSLEFEYDEFGNTTRETKINQRKTLESYGILIHNDKTVTNYYYGIVGKK